MTKLIDIGHSKGVRIPKNIIVQMNLEDCELEFEIVPKGLLIRKCVSKKRQGWAEAFKNAMPLSKDDINDFSNQFDNEDWVWDDKTHETI